MVKIISLSDFKSDKKGVDKKLDKANFLLKFDDNPNAVKEGLILLGECAEQGSKEATCQIQKIKKENLFKADREMFLFAYGKEIF